MKRITQIAISSAALLALAMPVLADDVRPSPTPTSAKANVECLQNAIDKRENALVSAVDAYASSVKAALNARKDALKKAVALSTPKERNKARVEAWQDHRKAIKAAVAAKRLAVGTAWNQYKTESKACKVGGEGVESPANKGADSQL